MKLANLNSTIVNLPATPAVINVDVEGLHNHEWAEKHSTIFPDLEMVQEEINDDLGRFDMYGVDEFEFRAIQQQLEEKNIGRANHRKHQMFWMR